jgi:hypothetical protein
MCIPSLTRVLSTSCTLDLRPTIRWDPATLTLPINTQIHSFNPSDHTATSLQRPPVSSNPNMAINRDFIVDRILVMFLHCSTDYGSPSFIHSLFFISILFTAFLGTLLPFPYSVHTPNNIYQYPPLRYSRLPTTHSQIILSSTTSFSLRHKTCLISFDSTPYPNKNNSRSST